jgi:hypothetical protein
MKTLKAFSTAALAVSFLIAPLAAQTAPPPQASEAAQTVSSNAPPPQAQQSAQEREKEIQRLQEEQRKLIEVQRKQAEVERHEMEGIVKTYSLKYVNANELMKAAKFYVYDWTASGNILTVKIARKFIPDFEALLKKLDIEKKNIQFQVYTVVATNEAPIETLSESSMR